MHNNVFLRKSESGVLGFARRRERVGFPVLLSKSLNWERQEQAGWMGRKGGAARSGPDSQSVDLSRVIPSVTPPLYQDMCTEKKWKGNAENGC